MPKLSYQLYSSRNWPLGETLSMVRTAGFAEVEGYGSLLERPDALKAALTEAGLRMTTAHIPLDFVEADPNGVLALAESLGLEAAFAPFIAADTRPKDRAGWHDFGARLAGAAAPLRGAGLPYGWHNHDFEPAALDDGTRPLDIIADAGVPLELDIGWLARAGEDPVATIKRYAGRIGAAHVKDVAPSGDNADEDGWADIGYGTIDWQSVHTALQEAGVERYVVEHDNPRDHERFARRSFASVGAF